MKTTTPQPTPGGTTPDPVCRVMLNGAQACAFLGVDPSTLKALRRARSISFFRVAHRTVTYSQADLEAFLQSRRVVARMDSGKAA